MSFFGSLARELKASSSVLEAGTLEEIWGRMFGGLRSNSGVGVNWNTALRVTAVLACARRINEGVSTVPFKLYHRPRDSNRRTEATDHPLFTLLDSGPNEWMDSLMFRDMLTMHAVLASNAYAYVNRVRGQITEMIPLRPDRVVCRQLPDYSLEYKVTAPDGTYAVLGPNEIWHIRGISWDGYRGMDVVNLAREAIGLSLATEMTHAMMHANGARPSGIVSVDRSLNEADLIRLAAWVKRHYTGLDNASRVMVLDSDAKFTPFDVKGVDAEHVKLRGHEVEEICRAMGVMPMVIGHPADMAARAAVEQIMLIHLVHTVRPWHRRFEHAADKQLLTEEERREGYYTKFVDGEFLRAAHKDRAEYNKIALGGGGNPGWATPNDVRGWDDMDAVDGGDHLYAPTNVGPIGPDGIPQTASPKPAESAPAEPINNDPQAGT